MTKSDAELTKLIAGQCRQHAERELGAECTVEGGPLSVAWSEVDLRHVAMQDLTIWRRLTEIQVLVDESGSVAGFVDASAWTDCARADLDDERILFLLAQTTIVGPDARIRARGFGDHGELALELEDGGRRFRAVINPARAIVIGIRPAQTS